MRRKEREVPYQRLKDIIRNCTCCRIGFNDEGKVYIVPLNFGYVEINNKHIFYFHGAKTGQKIEVLKKNSYVGFELDTSYDLIKADQACGYTANFQSIIGNGEVCLVENEEEKKFALQMIMEHNTGIKEWEFMDTMIAKTCIFKLEVTEMSGKEHQV